MAHPYLSERSYREEEERRQYVYSPSDELLRFSGYAKKAIGNYKNDYSERTHTYAITLLSQSSMTLLHKDEMIIAWQVVRDDDELRVFLAKYEFPEFYTE